MKSKSTPQLILSILLFSFVFNQAVSAENLVLAVHPYLSQPELLKKFNPLAKYLSKKTGINIKVKVGSSYSEHIKYIGKNKVDIAYMGPASFVKVLTVYGDKPILARLEIKGQPFFQGNIIARKDSGIKTLNDLKGKDIAFGDPRSTMSYIVPHHMLHKAGIYKGNVSKHQFLHSHNNVALGVLFGNFDAGAVKPAVFKKFENKGLIIVEVTPKISEHLFVTRTNLPVKVIAALKKAMLEMNKFDEGKAALRSIKSSITSLVSANSGDYDNLRTIINETKKLH